MKDDLQESVRDQIEEDSLTASMTPKVWLLKLVQDETGSPSSARVSFWLSLLFTLLMVFLDWLSPARDVPEPAYALLGTIFVICGVWAAGPRAMEYIGPQIGKIVSGMGAAKRTYRPPTQPDIRRDDERDPDWPT